jgi:hypothetical protein
VSVNKSASLLKHILVSVVHPTVNIDPQVAEDTEGLKGYQTFPNSRARVLFVGGLKITEGHSSFV